jgi:lambda repressor-like predicted transcriptional regulator
MSALNRFKHTPLCCSVKHNLNRYKNSARNSSSSERDFDLAAQTEKSVKLRDVAKAAGVSQGTASNAFSRPEIVREEVREHVLKVAKDLGYSGPSVTGRLLRGGKVNAVGVAAIEPLSYFFEDLWARQLMS